MRRPGYLGNVGYWFGDDCWVCDGGRCKNTCPAAKQKKKLKTRFKKQRKIAEQTAVIRTHKGLDHRRFALRRGESNYNRLKRLEAARLYIPGARMGLDYGNLVRYGTIDKQEVAKIKRIRRKKAREHLERVSTFSGWLGILLSR
jgi:hypothetical protein